MFAERQILMTRLLAKSCPSSQGSTSSCRCGLGTSWTLCIDERGRVRLEQNALKKIVI